MKQAVVCIVPTAVEAERTVDSLRSAGFTNNDISVLMPDRFATRDVGHEQRTKAPEGTSIGAGAGAALGGALGWLAGIGSLAIPGLGAFVAAGPIMAALGGAAVGGSVGGITGGLIGWGMPEYEAKVYEGKLRDGNVLLSVHTDTGEQAKRVEEIMKAEGAKDIKRVGEAKVRT